MKNLKTVAILTLMAAGLVGCGETNDTTAMTDPSGNSTNAVTPAGVPGSSDAARKAMEANNPMKGDPNYGKK